MSSAISAPTFDGGVENRVVDGFTSLLDEVDSEEIATRYEIGFHSNRIDFLEHVKIGLRLGIADPNTLEDLAQQTDVYADFEPISKGYFSKLTTRRPAQAVAELATVFPVPPPKTMRSNSAIAISIGSECVNAFAARSVLRSKAESA